MSLVSKAAVVMLAILAPSWVVGQANDRQVKNMTADELKRLYLACDRAAMRGVLGAGGIAQCSVAYEALKRKAFDGDFEKLLSWSRSQASVQNTTP